MNHRTIAFVTTAALLTACGSASDAVTFKAPPGYVAQVSIGPFAQTWQGPHDGVLMLMAIPKPLDLNKPLQTAPIASGKIERDEAIAICGNQPARYAEMTASKVVVGSATPDAEDRPEAIDFVATAIGGKTYMAIYIRPVGTAADPAAQAALRNVCPRSAAS